MVVNPGADPAVALAIRLRRLREEGLGGKRVTQKALGAAIDASGPLISSWESKKDPTAPPRSRLDAYATFFATDRSVAQTSFRVLPASQLTDKERTRRDELLQELTSLWDKVKGQQPDLEAVDVFTHGHWHFPPNEDITIVCSTLPPDYREPMPYTDPNAPDYVESYKYADLDALIELFGHLRVANPSSEVRIRNGNELKEDDYTTHLVVLGGVDWNPVTAELMRRFKVPVRQTEREDETVAGGFVVDDDERISPLLRTEDGREVLVEDVAHFFRARSPFNDKRTVTVCNGMYARGVYGVVRALTDKRFRDRNESYLRKRFDGDRPFSIVSRVKVVFGKTVTPDWNDGKDVLHEWQAA
jgi:hypothetical protein